jgi:hypothetical protein
MDYTDVLDQYLHYMPSNHSNTPKPAFFEVASQGTYYIDDNENEVSESHGVGTKNNGKNDLPTFNIKR